MDDVITLSSDSDKDDSDVEIVGSFSAKKDDPLPLTAVRVDVDALNVNVPTNYIDLTDPRWVVPELKMCKKQNSTVIPVVDLTENNLMNGTEQENLPPNDCEIRKENINIFQTSIKQDTTSHKSSGRDLAVIAPVRDSGDIKRKQRHLDSQAQVHKLTTEVSHHRTPTVKLKRLPFLETYVRELKKQYCSSVCLRKDFKQTSLCLKQLENKGALECTCNLRMTSISNGLHCEPKLEFPVVNEPLMEKGQENRNNSLCTKLHDKIPQNPQNPSSCSDNGGSGETSKEHSTYKDEMDSSSTIIPAPAPSASSPDKALCFPQLEVHSSNTSSRIVNTEWDQMESSQSCLSEYSSVHAPATELNPSQSVDLNSLSHTSPESQNQTDSPPTSDHILTENISKSEEVKLDGASNSCDSLCCSIPSQPPLSETKTEDMDGGSDLRFNKGSGNGSYRGDMGMESPMSVFWEEGIGGEDVHSENSFEVDFREATLEDRHFVCPVTVRRIMIGPPQALIDEEEGLGNPEVLCRQSLSLVYSTIDEKYTEGTLQLLSDLLQPGYYPPKDITSHLLQGILLDPQCPHHLCVQAFNLLMRTQRHHIVDKSTVPWDWELLTSVMANQDHTKTYRCEVVRMLLEYAVQTLEDDFKAKHATSALNHSIAKTTLSCDQKFPHVRDVIKWLFSAILKSTEKSRSAAEERDEQVKMVSVFQRMLSLALEVDCSPALISAKLSQELFHMLISNVPLRAHRMLLLESLQSKLLRCKLLEHLLDYACPVKTSLPMSLSLLLHFLKSCTLTPDPADGAERWQRWEELIHLLWMLLLSYNNAMKGYLGSSVTKQRDRVGTLVYRPDDMISKSAVREAVEAFLSRSKDDLGEALPLHVEESLTYLQDHLLDACQC